MNPSGWLAGMDPAWTLVRGKALFTERKEKSKADDIHLTPSQHLGVLPQTEYMERSGSRVVLNLTGADQMKHVEPDDFVIHLRSFQGGIEHSRYSGKVSNAYTILVPDERCEPRFFRWVLKCSGFIQELNSLTDQLRDGQSIKYSQFAAMELPLPPIEEQRRIANFLDDQVGRIDQAIELRRAQIELASASLDAAIVELTSRGVDVAANVAATDLPWIPKANPGWELIALRYLLRELREIVGEESRDYLLLSLTRQGVIPRDLDSNFGKFPSSFDGYQAVYPGDIVACLFDVDETPRTFGIARSHGMVTGAYTRFRVSTDRVLANYLTYALIGIDNLKAFRPLYTGMRKGIQTGRLLSAKLPIPDLGEQQRIVEALQELEQRVTQEVALLRLQSDLLAERKRSLITAAVTGQLDVTAARPINVGAWVPNVGVEAPIPSAPAVSMGGI